MKAINQSLLSLLLLTVFATAVAADDQKSSRSAGKLQGDQSIDLAQELEQREPLVYPNSGVAENYASRPANAANAEIRGVEADFTVAPYSAPGLTVASGVR